LTPVPEPALAVAPFAALVLAGRRIGRRARAPRSAAEDIQSADGGRSGLTSRALLILLLVATGRAVARADLYTLTATFQNEPVIAHYGQDGRPKRLIPLSVSRAGESPTAMDATPDGLVYYSTTVGIEGIGGLYAFRPDGGGAAARVISGGALYIPLDVSVA